MFNVKQTLLIFITIIALLVILSPINASELDLNQSDSSTLLEITSENNSILTDGNSYSIGGDGESDEDYYDFHNDPTIERASGTYHGPYSEPSIVINEFNISLGQVISNNYVTVNVTFDGVIQSNIFTLDRYPLTIKENNKKIGTVPVSSVSNTNYPTDQSTPYKFTASFTYKLKNYDTELKLRLCGFESNTLVFKYIDTIKKFNLNENSIIISNKNENYTSNSSWFNTIDSLENAITLAEDNSTIYLNNIELFSNKEFNINKNLTIIGNNAIINGFKINNMITVNSNVKFINITFKNASNYILNINNDSIIENCTFSDTNIKVINNTASLKIIDSKFENINSVTETNDKTTLTVIYNQNTLEIINSTFTNIALPNTLELNNKIINTSYIIYNLNKSNLKIYNTKFDNNNARTLNNDGKTLLNQTNITNTILLPDLVKIDTINFKINNNHVLKSSLEKTATPEMILGEIYNTDELNITESYLENITWSYNKGLVYNLPGGKSYTWYYETKPYYKISGFAIDRSTSFLNKAGSIYNLGELNIDKTTFNNFKASYSGTIENEGTLTINNTIINNSNSQRDGGAITNRKTMNMNNSAINHAVASGGYYGNGGGLYNTGNVTIDKSNFTYCEGALGEAIYNRGNADVSNSIFDSAKDSSIFNFNGGVLYNLEDGNFTLSSSIIKNSRFKQASSYPTEFYGVVINEGNMDITRTVFDNNTPLSPQNIIGTYNLYNMGKMNATYNIFINTMRSQSGTTHVYAMDSENGLYMNYNYFDYNKDPYKVHTNMEVNQFFVLSIEPDYLALDINDTTTLNVYLKLNNGKFYTDYSKLPEMNITINVDGKNITKTLIDGKTSILINNTPNKGTEYVTAYYGDWNQTVQIDVGKENSSMIFEAEEIFYGENATFYMTVTGNYTHQPAGNITVIIDSMEYTTKIKDTKAEITISGLIPKTYDLIIRYEGDEDYFKAIHHQNYTVHKRPVNMNISIPEIYYGETGVISVELTEGVSSQAYMYITDETNKTVKKTVYVRDGAELKLKNYAAGEYNITIETWENLKYETCNVTAIFKVNKYTTNLTINASDIDAGETEYLNITLSPKGEVAGEAILTINNHTEIIFLKNGENTVTINNVTGGMYTVTVTFPGDKKYGSSNATATFTAKKLQSNVTAKIENNNLYITVEPKTTGTVLIYINDDIYEINLTDSAIELPINFTKAENNIFIYYQGNGYYNYSTCNLTYEYEGLVNLTGYDETFYNTQNATYYLTLTDEEGYGIANKNITITINNEPYIETTGYDGSITIKLDLNIGKYTVTAQYKNKTIKNTITILEDAFLNGNDTQAYTDIDFTYTTQLKDHKGKAITNAEITFKIDEKTYTNKTDENGIAVLNLNLKEGNYTITSTYKTVNIENNIHVGDLILKGNDLTIYNTQNGTYKVTLTNENGTGITNQTITISLNNKTETKNTDENGTAAFSIKLDTGTYTITAQFNDQKTTNKINVLEDAFLSVNNTKAYENTNFTHIAQLKDHNGKAIANAEITFQINGKTYTNTTDSEGKANVNLNLKEGNYTITSTYKNITKIAKIIIVDDSHLIGNDVKAYSGVNFTYRTKLTDHNNNPMTDAEITFKIGNETHTNKTDSNGEATLTFNLETGNYTITANYKNTTIENSFEIIEDYILRGNDIKAYAETDFQYRVNLTDHNGKAMKNAEVTFKVDGATYTNTTDSEGKAIINLNLKLGNHTIKTTYRNTTTENNLEMIEDYILSGNDIKAYAETDFQYKVNLTDHNGKTIANAEITFEVNGKTYTNTTDNNGQAILNLNLNEGNYTIKTAYKNTTATNELEIIENHLITGQNIRAFENTDFKYTITLTRTDGTPINGKTITFVINNRRYTSTTNETGQASRTLNLPEGNYTITAIYKNTAITNNLTIIEEYNLNATNIKTYAETDFQYKVNLTNHDGKAVNNAEITFEVDGKTYTNKTDNNGQARLNLNLKEGNYTITSTYRNIKLTGKLEIIETYQLTGINIKSYENFNFDYIVTLTNHNNKTIENQIITIDVDGKTYTNTTNQNGQATITLNLKKGNYTITASYGNISTSNILNIIEYDLEKIESENLEMFYRDGSRFTIRITENSTPLTNRTVKFTINGATYTRTTDSQGYAGIAINLNSGKYNITTQYNNLTKVNSILVKSTINGNDLVKMFRNDTQYRATFYNKKGELLKNTQIMFNINGVLYYRNTNENGTAQLTINLNTGEYIITATNPETGEQYSNTITVISKIQENHDLTKYYRNESQYSVKIIKSNGEVARKGEKVTLNINGVLYERYTNENGTATLNINLRPGTYIITAEYEGCQASNNIKVLPTLQAKDLTKKYGTANPFEATLLNGQGKPQANEKITFNINGVFYDRTTDENGTARLNINLQPGEYIITSQYGTAITSNTVKVTP